MSNEFMREDRYVARACSLSTEPEHTTQEKIMDQSAYALIEVSPDGSTKIHEVFEAESPALAKEYASARNETELDWYVQRFREEGPVPLGRLTRMEDGRLMAFPLDPQTQPAPSVPEGVSFLDTSQLEGVVSTEIVHSYLPPSGWLRAIDEALVTAHISVANAHDTYEQAKAKLDNLIGFNVDTATDPAVNGGYKLVPIEPTQEMIDHVIDERLDALAAGKDHTFIDIYKAMLASAPEAKP